MRTIKKLSLVVALALASLNTYAIDGDFLLNVKKAKGSTISFSVNGKQKVTVSIYDLDHNLLFSEIATGNKGISKIYNLEQFPDGKYILVVENDLKKVSHKIEISKNQTLLERKAVAEVYKNNSKKLIASRN